MTSAHWVKVSRAVSWRSHAKRSLMARCQNGGEGHHGAALDQRRTFMTGALEV